MSWKKRDNHIIVFSVAEVIRLRSLSGDVMTMETFKYRGIVLTRIFESGHVFISGYGLTYMVG